VACGRRGARLSGGKHTPSEGAHGLWGGRSAGSTRHRTGHDRRGGVGSGGKGTRPTRGAASREASSTRRGGRGRWWTVPVAGL
jgi:hypothetical protein